jgi:exosome complex component RRP4
MVNMITERTGCDVKIGQNGVIVVVGPPDGIVKTAKAIKMIETETQAFDLTRRVEEFLGGAAVES